MNGLFFQTLLLAGAIPCAVAAVYVPAGISDALRPPPDEEPAFVLNAHGASMTASQRGGVEPAAPCSAAMAGREARVTYMAEYHFYKRTGASKPAVAY